MKIKNCLFIADENVEEITDKVIGSLRKEGITFNFQHIDLRDERYYIEDTENSGRLILDFDRIKQEINDKFINLSFDVVACDFIYGKDPLDGFKVIKWLKNESESKRTKIRRASFILYSSEQEKLIPKTNSVDELRKLIRLKIEDFVDRRQLAETLIKLLATENIDLGLFMITELEKYKSLEFKSGYPVFKGKAIEYVAAEIEKQTHHGVRFQNSIIEYAIATMIAINE